MTDREIADALFEYLFSATYIKPKPAQAPRWKQHPHALANWVGAYPDYANPAFQIVPTQLFNVLLALIEAGNLTMEDISKRLPMTRKVSVCPPSYEIDIPFVPEIENSKLFGGDK